MREIIAATFKMDWSAIIFQSLPITLITSSRLVEYRTAWAAYMLTFGEQRILTVNSWVAFQSEFFGMTLGGSQKPFQAPFAHGLNNYLHVQPEFENGDWCIHLMLTEQEKKRLVNGLKEDGLEDVIRVI